jgi:MoaA/NifB/PqqE/SkfB family radical SAM enzyme
MACDLTILYRGPLASCNYRCHYCPFTKRQDTRADLAADRQALERFAGWAQGFSDGRLSVFFTPWGEGLIHPWYQEALVALTNTGHLDRVVIQTNLSCPVDWVDRCNTDRLALWCSYHPTQTQRSRFTAQCSRLDARGIRYSVGVVGLNEFLREAQLLRREISSQVYLWVNAYKDVPDYYGEDDIRNWEAIDPHFRLNVKPHPSYGKFCRSGESVFAVDGDGTICRCHLIAEPIGNIYDPDFRSRLRQSPCTNQFCGCHIGYVHLVDLGLYDIFRHGVLERIPLG